MSDEVTPKASEKTTAPDETYGSPIWLVVGFGVVMAALLLYGFLMR